MIACAISPALSEDNAQHTQPLEKIATWPKAEKGMKRLVITLPEQQNEDDYKVELLPSRIMEVDCNKHRLVATLETHTLSGWGYDYFILSKVSKPVSTMMASLDNKKIEQFIPAYLGDAGMLRYNSKLPIVVYAAENMEMRYRIWKADDIQQNAIER